VWFACDEIMFSVAGCLGLNLPFSVRVNTNVGPNRECENPIAVNAKTRRYCSRNPGRPTSDSSLWI